MAEVDDANLFETTRGKLLLLLCQGPQTVNELCEALGVTDNAVRAQLAGLQEAGFVRPIGLRSGTRRPHVDYELTPKARALFPRAHEPVLRVLLDVLRERLPRDETEAILKRVAQTLVTSWLGELREPQPRGRLAELVARLKGLTAGVAVEDSPTAGPVAIRACGCPLASVTASHPEVCGVLADVLGELLGTTVRERCDRRETPRCCFEIDPGAA
jgi:predicted ArsR family transcriptional regulator